jgi:hypothetical protein
VSDLRVGVFLRAPMSVKAMGWAYDQRVMDPVRKAVLMAIANIVDEDGYGWPSLKRIAWMTEASIRTVQRAIQDLEAAGFLEVERGRVRETGAGTSNAYQLPMASRQLPLLPHDNVTPPQTSGRRGEGVTLAGEGASPRHGEGDSGVTPYELPLERSVRTVNGKKAPKPPGFVVPEWVPPVPWESFKAMRKSIRAPLTDAAAELTVRELARLRELGFEPGAVLEQSVMRSWRGVFPIKADASSRGESVVEHNRRVRDEIRREQGIDP